MVNILKRLTSALRPNQSEFPKEVGGQKVPHLLHELVKSDRWPKKYRIDSSKLVAAGELPFLDDVDLCLLSSIEEVQSENSFMRELAKENMYGLTFGGSESNMGCQSLDAEKAVCFSTGADWGDDLWICLDYRHSSDTPCVVANDMSGDETTWHVVAPNFKVFCQRLGLLDGTWKKGKFGYRYAAFYR